jgi:hypothetical protein
VSEKGSNKGVVAAALLGLASLAYAGFALLNQQHQISSHRSSAVGDTKKATNSDVDFERSDMSVALIAVLAVTILAFVGLTPFVLTRIYRPALSDADRQLTIDPPAPKLQLDPPADLATLNAHEATQLAAYGWVDRATGIAHIPLGRAMQDIATRGIPDFPRAPQ